jgi:hypothetical protein
MDANSRGYRRIAKVKSDQQPADQPEPEVTQPPAELETPGRTISTDLANRLETATRHSLRTLEQILALPLDTTNGNILRAKTAAAGAVLSAQLKADENKLRSARDSGVMARLLAEVRKQRKILAAAPPPTLELEGDEVTERESQDGFEPRAEA